jgi:heme exporter protein D
MQPAYDPASSGLFLSLGIAMIAVFLGLSQWYEWRARDPDLPVKDLSYYRRQDLRRSAGVVLLLWLAIEIWSGSRIPHRIGQRPNPTFLFIWLSVGIKLIVLIALAMLDLLHTRRYARRHRRSMIIERLKLVRDARRQKADGQAPPSSERPPDGK